MPLEPRTVGKKKLLIVDDHDLVRALLRHLCTDHFNLEVAGEASTGVGAIDEVYKIRPDLVLLDLDLPDISGFDVLDGIRHVNPFPPVIVVSALCTDYVIHRCRRAPIKGFIDKQKCLIEPLREASKAVLAGGTFFSPHFHQQKAALTNNPNAFEKILSEHEQLILAMIAARLPLVEIARRLGISVKTVETHNRNLSARLELHGRQALGSYAAEIGLDLRLTPKQFQPRYGTLGGNNVNVRPGFGLPTTSPRGRSGFSDM